MAQTTVALKRAERELETVLEKQRDLPRQLSRGSPDGVRTFVSEIWKFFSKLSTNAGLSPDVAPAITGAVVQESFPSLIQYQRGRPQDASKLLIDRWRTYTGEHPSKLPPSQNVELKPNDFVLLALFAVMVATMFTSATRASRGPAIITRLMGSLDLSYDDIGRMLGVSGETVRRWAQRKTELPEKHLATLDVADSALTRLQSFFLPERLPSVIRREAELFDRGRALDYVLQGRIADVVDRYEQILSFQE